MIIRYTHVVEVEVNVKNRDMPQPLVYNPNFTKSLIRAERASLEVVRPMEEWHEPEGGAWDVRDGKLVRLHR